MSLTHIISVLNRTFTVEFYRMNSGFFLLFGTIAFGFMSEIEHRALAQFFVSGMSTIMIPVGLWALYTLKIAGFNNDQLHLPSNNFLFAAQFLPQHQLLLVCAQTFALQLFPAIAYGLFLVVMALPLPGIRSIVIITLALLACLVFGTAVLMRSVRNPVREKRISFLTRFFDKHFVRPLIQFYAEWLMRKAPFMIGGIKILTGAVLFGICMLYRNEAYDWRLLAMAVTVCGAANILIVFHLVTFEHLHIGWIKNLPLATGTRFLRLLAALVLFIIPETVVLIRNFPPHLDLQWMVLTITYLVSLVAFFLGFLHTSASPVEYFTKRSFWILIILIVLILFKIPLILLAGINMIAGYALFRNYYYLFERTNG